ncbi:unnamed protein product, partial [Ectocarpus sp. 6 AP-2014]
CRAVSKRLFWARGLHHPPARGGRPKPGEEVRLLRPQRARARWRHEAVLRAAARSRRQDLAAWVQVQTQRCKHQGVLTFLANTHAKRFGFESGMLDRRAVFIIHSYSYGSPRACLRLCPLDGPLERTQTGGCSCRHIAKGPKLRCASASQTLLVVGRRPVLHQRQERRRPCSSHGAACYSPQGQCRDRELQYRM